MEALWPILKSKMHSVMPKKTARLYISWGLRQTAVYTLLWNICLRYAISQKNTDLKKYLSTASWTAVIPTLEAEKALSSRLPSIVQSLSAQ